MLPERGFSSNEMYFIQKYIQQMGINLDIDRPPTSITLEKMSVTFYSNTSGQN